MSAIPLPNLIRPPGILTPRRGGAGRWFDQKLRDSRRWLSHLMGLPVAQGGLPVACGGIPKNDTGDSSCCGSGSGDCGCCIFTSSGGFCRCNSSLTWTATISGVTVCPGLFWLAFDNFCVGTKYYGKIISGSPNGSYTLTYAGTSDSGDCVYCATTSMTLRIYKYTTGASDDCDSVGAWVAANYASLPHDDITGGKLSLFVTAAPGCAAPQCSLTYWIGADCFGNPNSGLTGPDGEEGNIVGIGFEGFVGGGRSGAGTFSPHTSSRGSCIAFDIPSIIGTNPTAIDARPYTLSCGTVDGTTPTYPETELTMWFGYGGSAVVTPN